MATMASEATGGATVIYEATDLGRTFGQGAQAVRAVHDVNLSIPEGAFVALVGPSGSGKSTLLGLLGGLERPTRGMLLYRGLDLGSRSDRELTALRAREFGFVFQAFNLMPTLSARENVEVAMVPLGTPTRERRARARELLERVGLGARLEHLPSRLSGGEQQRVSIARALACDPRVIVADEPTGNLDTARSEEIVDLFEDLRRERGVTVVLATHDPDIARHATVRVLMRDGTLASIEIDR